MLKGWIVISDAKAVNQYWDGLSFVNDLSEAKVYYLNSQAMNGLKDARRVQSCTLIPKPEK